MSNQLPVSYTTEETRTAIESAAAAGAGDYKCLVCIFLFGASDSHNMVIPYGNGNPNRSLYETARAYGVRLGDKNVTNQFSNELDSMTLNDAGGPGTSPGGGAPAYEWALHPSLTGLRSDWYDGDLAIVRDVGVLNRPTTKELYNTNPNDLYRPDRLFAHNIQQLAWQKALPFRSPESTGWFGRTTNLLDEFFNPDMRVSSGCISVSGANPQTFAYSPKVNVVYPATIIPGGDSRSYANFDTTRDNFYHKNSPDASPVGYPPLPKNNVMNAFSRIFRNSVDSQAAVNSNGGGWVENDGGIGTQLEAIFDNANTEIINTTLDTPDPNDVNGSNPRTLPNSYFINIMKNVAKVIYSRGDVSGVGFNQRRQLIFSGVGGWDNHNNLRYFHDPNLKTLDICIKALRDAVKLMGLENNVTIFTETDFGRTFRSNGTFGTDHAWSGHSFVVGGAVKGGMYGPEPDYTLGGDKDVSNLGRFIPNYSIEQYYGTLLKWFDIPDAQIPLVLPAINLFTPSDIGFMN